MFKFLAGVATGWMLARSPPTQDEINKWIEYIVDGLKQLKKLR